MPSTETMTPAARASEMFTRPAPGAKEAALDTVDAIVETRKGTGCGPYWAKVAAILRGFIADESTAPRQEAGAEIEGNCHQTLMAQGVAPGDEFEAKTHDEAMLDMDPAIKAKMGRKA